VNLVFKDIGALPGIKTLLKCVDNLRVFIRNHHATKAVYDRLAKTSLLKPGRTRFAFQIIGLRNVLKNQQALVDTLSADEVDDFIYSNGSTKDKDEIRLRVKFAQLKDIFLDPEGKVWKRMRILCALLAPIEQLLRFVELDLPVMSKLHDAWTRLIAYLEDARSAHLTRSPSSKDALIMTDIIRITKNRFAYGYSPLHLVTHLLDPEFVSQEYNQDQFDIFVKYLQERVLFNTPRELVNSECGILVREFSVYRNQEASFASELAQKESRTLSAARWWDSYGRSTPNLRLVAMRVCSCIAGASSSERAHKTMGFVHSKVRNRTLPDRVQKQVYLMHNLKNCTAFVESTMMRPPALTYTREFSDESQEIHVDDTLSAGEVAWMGYSDTSEEDTSDSCSCSSQEDASGVATLEHEDEEGPPDVPFLSQLRANTELGWQTEGRTEAGMSRSGRLRFKSIHARGEVQYYDEYAMSSTSATPVFPIGSGSGSGSGSSTIAGVPAGPVSEARASSVPMGGPDNAATAKKTSGVAASSSSSSRSTASSKRQGPASTKNAKKKKRYGCLNAVFVALHQLLLLLCLLCHAMLAYM
jgi:hypothetical protein